MVRLSFKHDVGEWYAIVTTDREEPSKPDAETIPDKRIRGADLGLARFATLDNSDTTSYPKFLRLSEDKIKTLQRRLARKKRGSREMEQHTFPARTVPSSC